MPAVAQLPLPTTDRITSATVMFVEDREDNLWVLQMLLEEIGVGYVGACTDGDELLGRIRAEHLQPDLVLLDLQLPDEDGYTLFKRLRRIPMLSDVPMAAVSANVTPGYIKQAQGLGMNGFIGKPINRDALPDQIKRLLCGEAVWEPHR